VTELIIGSCCACRQRRRLRNVMMLPQKAPIPGTGWGCVVCKLSGDGAIALVCDRCVETRAAIVDACRGYLKDGRRTPIAELAGSHAHDARVHQDFERGEGVR